MSYRDIQWTEADLDEFIEVMSHPTRQGMKLADISRRFHISQGSIYNVLRRPDVAKRVRDKRFERIKLRLPEIDLALVQKAVNGDVKAITLVYERWDDFVSRQGIELSKKPELTDEEVAKRKARLTAYIAKARELSQAVLPAMLDRVAEGGESSKSNALPIPVSTGTPGLEAMPIPGTPSNAQAEAEGVEVDPADPASSS